jgi:hypothetical protein
MTHEPVMPRTLPHHPSFHSRKLMPTDTAHDLDGIIAALNSDQQRATYSAVAALLGQSPRALMKGHPRAPENSWIVSKSTGLPSGYADTDMHPELTARPSVLKTREELESWLANRSN